MPATPEAPTNQPLNARQAFERCMPAMLAIATADLRHPNLDVPESMLAMLQALPELATLRPEFVTKLPTHDMAAFDALGDQTLGLWHAHTEVLASEAEENAEVKSLTAEGAALRTLLIRDAELLQGRGILGAKALEELKNTQGSLSVAADLQTLVSIVRNVWPKACNRTGTSLEELAHAEDLGNRILAALGVAPRGGAESKPTVVMRMRAFTLFIRNYNETRRAVEYLRYHEGDADRFCPPLWTGKRNKKSAPNEEESAKPEPEGDQPAKPEEPIAPGMPGGNPFLT